MSLLKPNLNEMLTKKLNLDKQTVAFGIKYISNNLKGIQMLIVKKQQHKTQWKGASFHLRSSL